MAGFSLQGLVIAIAGIVALALNQVLNLGLGAIAFGLAMGAVLGPVSDGGPVGRAGSFIVGMLIAMVLFRDAGTASQRQISSAWCCRS